MRAVVSDPSGSAAPALAPLLTPPPERKPPHPDSGLLVHGVVAASFWPARPRPEHPPRRPLDVREGHPVDGLALREFPATVVGDGGVRARVAGESLDEAEAAVVVLSDPPLLQDMLAAAEADPLPQTTGAALRGQAERDRERHIEAWASFGPTGRLIATSLADDEVPPGGYSGTRFESKRGPARSVRVIHRLADGREAGGEELGPHEFVHVARRAGRDGRPWSRELLAPSFLLVGGTLVFLVAWPLLAGRALLPPGGTRARATERGAGAPPPVRAQGAPRLGPARGAALRRLDADFSSPSVAEAHRVLALGLLPTWLLLALRWPSRGLHDLVSGTWVVRR